MKKVMIVILVITASIIRFSSFAQTTPTTGLQLKNYYKVKWGHADEFIAPWKKNHYPLLKELLEYGDVLSIKAETPMQGMIFKNNRISINKAFTLSIFCSQRKTKFPPIR